MTSTHQYSHPALQFRTTLLASGTQRLLFFIIISLALHSLLLSLIPGKRLFALSGQLALRTPIIVSLDTTSSPHGHNPRQAQHSVHPAAFIKASPVNHPTDKLPFVTRQPHHIARAEHTVTPNQSNRSYYSEHVKHPTVPFLAKQTQHQQTEHAPKLSPINHSDYAMQMTSRNLNNITASPDPAAVAALLRTALLKHFHYPTVALQNNWQGKVIIGMRMSANGQVHDAQILQTSGFYILDLAAQHSVNAIGQIPAARPLLAGKTLQFRIPVRYRLQD